MKPQVQILPYLHCLSQSAMTWNFSFLNQVHLAISLETVLGKHLYHHSSG
jgi:hypothetical protein